jgi:GDP-D-mannose dehydratase
MQTSLQREDVATSSASGDKRLIFGITIQWQGANVDECGLCKMTNRKLVQVDPRYIRTTEVETLCGNPAKALGRTKTNLRAAW